MQLEVPRKKISRDVTGQEGQILVLVAIMMPMMLVMVGLVLDGGFIYAESRRSQAAADAVALAAATYIWKNSTADCSAVSAAPLIDTCGALAYASALEYSSATNATVTITHPAAVSGTYSSTDYATVGDYVLVDIQRDIPQFFIGAVFPQLAHANSTAIGGIARVPMEYALVALGDPCTSSDNGTSGSPPAATGGISVAGSGDLTVNNGAMLSNCSGTAVNITGSGGISGDGIQTNGICSPSPLPTPTPSGTATTCETGVAQISDPMGALSWPCSSASTGNNASAPYCTSRGSVTGNVGTRVLEPGIYDEIAPTGNSTLWLKTGIYVLRGSVTDAGLDVSGNTGIKDCSATGAPAGCTGFTGGVLFFNGTNEYDGTRSPGNNVSTLPNPCNDNTAPAPTGSSINFIGNGGFSLIAKTSGPYAGMAVWQGCGLTNTLSFTGNATSQITGTVYAPDARVDLDGSANWTTPSAIVAKYVRMKGSSDLLINYNHNLAYKPFNVVLAN